MFNNFLSETSIANNALASTPQPILSRSTSNQFPSKLRKVVFACLSTISSIGILDTGGGYLLLNYL